MPIYDTGLVILLVHADATYLVAYRAVWVYEFGHTIASTITPPHTNVPWRRDLVGIVLGCTYRKSDWKGIAHVGQMDAILTDSHLETKIDRRILKNVIAPKQKCAGDVWEGKSKLVKQLDTVQMTAATTSVRMLMNDR